MSVIARAEVTVASITDVASTTRYYRLQSSTLNPPSKPTTSPPSGWTTTEPTYTEGSTNSLYTCDLTTFSDGTWSYSAVSLSSSYEASKAAYNRAVAAANAAAGANAAATAPTYKIVANCSSVSQDPSGACTPSSLSCRSYKTVASTAGTTSDSYYAGRLTIDASADGSSWTCVYTATANSSLATKALSSIVSAVEGCAYIRVTLYQAGGTTTQLAQAMLSVVQATGNYLQHGSSGLYVCETQGDHATGSALRLASDIIELIKDGVVKMSVGESEISLGIDDVQALIKMCGGMGQIGYDTTSDQIYLGSANGASLHYIDDLGIMSDDGIGITHDETGSKAIIRADHIEMGGYPNTDFVIDYGASGDWRYRKYLSGHYELLCDANVPMATDQNTGNIWVCNMVSVDIPAEIRPYSVSYAQVIYSDESTGTMCVQPTTTQVAFRVFSWYQTPYVWGGRARIFLVGRWRE